MYTEMFVVKEDNVIQYSITSTFIIVCHEKISLNYQAGKFELCFHFIT